MSKRELLLRAHRFRLRREDLEDCYSQATLELVLRARRGDAFASRLHIANALEQRFLSRIADRRRALGGRSAIQSALEGALPLGGDTTAGEELDLVDRRAELEDLVLLRHDLRRVEAVAQRLSTDQRLVLATQVGLQMGRGEFCRRYGWTPEKYRKVAQRGRARLRALMAAETTEAQEDRAADGRTARRAGPACTEPVQAGSAADVPSHCDASDEPAGTHL